MGRAKRAPRTGPSEPALSYLRVSGRGQVDGDGFPRQRDAVARYARAHGVELVGEYRDEGVSGTRDLDDREGLGELIERIRSNGVRLVLVERADRGEAARRPGAPAPADRALRGAEAFRRASG